jgi:AhpD family alkylhydroperoxidase
VDASGLGQEILDLIQLRASHLTGCAYCVDMHTKDMQAHGESVERIAGVRRIFPNREHEIVPGTGDDGATVDFFERHTGRGVPRTLAFAAATMAHACHDWLEVLEKEEVPGTVAMKGEAGNADAVRESIDDHNIIHLDTQHVQRLRLLLRPDLFDHAGDETIVLNGKTVFAGPVSYDCAVFARSWAVSQDPYLAYSAEMAFDVPR